MNRRDVLANAHAILWLLIATAFFAAVGYYACSVPA